MCYIYTTITTIITINIGESSGDVNKDDHLEAAKLPATELSALFPANASGRLSGSTGAVDLSSFIPEAANSSDSTPTSKKRHFEGTNTPKKSRISDVPVIVTLIYNGEGTNTFILIYIYIYLTSI